MRLIDADALQKLFNEVSSDLLHKPELTKDIEHIIRACLMVAEMISDAPTIEAEPIKHGRWLIYNILDYAKRPTGRKVGKCSVCGQLTPDFRLITEEPNWNYCPNCGARMDESEAEE